MKQIGLIGFGAIGQSIARDLVDRPVAGHRLARVLVRPRQMVELPRDMAGVAFTDDADGFFDEHLDIVVEAANQEAVATFGPAVLRRGCDFFILSTGALGDCALRSALIADAAAGGGRIAIPGGAMAGFRGLLSLRRTGLTAVTYISTKPPLAWAGTLAASGHALDALDAPLIIFSGSARDAARDYPRNANLAAAVALAGIGFDETLVQLIADPDAVMNSGRIIASGPTGRLDLTLSGPAFGANPKSSEITGMSVGAALENSVGSIMFV